MDMTSRGALIGDQPSHRALCGECGFSLCITCVHTKTNGFSLSLSHSKKMADQWRLTRKVDGIKK
jgi:hypothetical protein